MEEWEFIVHLRETRFSRSHQTQRRGSEKHSSRLLTVSLQSNPYLPFHLKRSRKSRPTYPTSMALGFLKPWMPPTGGFPDLLTAAGHGDLYRWNPLLPVPMLLLLSHPTLPQVPPPLQNCALSASSILWIHTWLSTPWSQMPRLCGWPSKTLSRLYLHNSAWTVTSTFHPVCPKDKWLSPCPTPLFLVPSPLLLEVNDFGDCLLYLTLWLSCPWESQPLRCELGLVIYF